MASTTFKINNDLQLVDQSFSSPASSVVAQIAPDGKVSAATSLTISKLTDAVITAGPLFDVYSFGPSDVKGPTAQVNDYPVTSYSTDSGSADSSINELTFFNNSGSGLNLSTGVWTVPATGDYFISVNSEHVPTGGDPGQTGPFLYFGESKGIGHFGNNEPDSSVPVTRNVNTEVRLPAGQQVSVRIVGTGTDGVNTSFVKWRVVRKANHA